ncbi:MAG: hypothetical protein HOC93_01255 [Phycisphaerae bacterium]|jgi:hypothetical protein|nr:hypothetical protein [Phycisphaerae bacterium]HJN72244.1 hypothetical protein [Phycisphaerales bacterium]|tara:strand:- start:845 stop:1195 length:351 start_codon:yes stop_codon:yes gene_type:complete
MKKGWKHAFHVDDAEAINPTEQQKNAIDKLCKGIIRRGLTTPAIIGVEMGRPLNFVGSQTMHFFTPLIAAFVPTDSWKAVAEFLEHRGSIDWIRNRIEELENEMDETPNKPEEPTS